MEIIYKVLNPKDGLYQTEKTQELAQTLASKLAWEFYLEHTHGKPISKVIVTEEGFQIWGQDKDCDKL